MKRIVTIAAVILVAFLPLAGCASSGTSSEPTTAAAAGPRDDLADLKAFIADYKPSGDADLRVHTISDAKDFAAGLKSHAADYHGDYPTDLDGAITAARDSLGVLSNSVKVVQYTLAKDGKGNPSYTFTLTNTKAKPGNKVTYDSKTGKTAAVGFAVSNIKVTTRHALISSSIYFYDYLEQAKFSDNDPNLIYLSQVKVNKTNRDALLQDFLSKTNGKTVTPSAAGLEIVSLIGRGDGTYTFTLRAPAVKDDSEFTFDSKTSARLLFTYDADQ